MDDIPLRCRCGALQGRALAVSARTTNRVVCYCRDCQAFARFLGDERILDAHGGSDILQLTPSQVRLDRGAENLACVRLSSKGLMRWYARCCRTPIGNGPPSSRVPFVGLVQPLMDHAEGGPSRDAVLGPPRFHVQTSSAIGGLPPGVDARLHPRALLHGARLMAGAFLGRKHRPTPFFDARGEPVVEPLVLDPAARAALDG